ncbi:hypothetical protein BG015_008385 [Linnemannia schmuckeri]|uniref:Uncharacterized protein n=1 Tax=Linnemannia schmuckeri TaxID=64567 RepID=A0A9P5RZ44_9FUNG|nr:hypothetical protein BG015_008385 [Linnemannia schmuckeri]
MDKVSAPRGILLPVADTSGLYAREAYKDLQDTIVEKFENNRLCTGKEVEKRFIVTALLAKYSIESRSSFQLRQSPYFPRPAKFKDVEKEVAWRYYMAPWYLEELQKCRTSVAGFEVVPMEAVEELYSKIGGVLKLSPDDLDGAKVTACERLEQALKTAKDPVTLMQYFSQAKESVAALLSQDAGNQVLKWLIADPNGSASGIMFEASVLRAFREGGRTFEIKGLETEDLASLDIPQISKNYLIKGPPLSKLIGSLIQARWIRPLDEPRLNYVVLSHVYADFEKQDYFISEGKIYRTVSADLLRVKQYVLKIDLQSTTGGKSPGLQIPMLQYAGTTT